MRPRPRPCARGARPLRHHVADSIKKDPNWQAAEKAVEAAKKIAENADQKARKSEADLAEKRKPYENDPLFFYLWNKHYGQSRRQELESGALL